MSKIPLRPLLGQFEGIEQPEEDLWDFKKSWPWAASGSMDQKLIIWDLQHSCVHCTCDHEEGVTCLLWLGTSRFIATGCAGGKVRVWDSRTGSCLRTFNGHTDTIQSLAVSGNSLISVSMDGTARVFGISEFQ